MPFFWHLLIFLVELPTRAEECGRLFQEARLVSNPQGLIHVVENSQWYSGRLHGKEEVGLPRIHLSVA